jgi:hypothetical protein
MDTNDLRTLSRVLVFGTDATRRALALRMAAVPDPEFSRVLGETVRSSEPEDVRGRCREVLGIMADAGDPFASGVLDELSAAPA